MFVLGTAGHVDHGKSSFLRALTGQEPDRLPEEKKRGMTIDLNFVWIPTEKWGRVGIVDVPGHQRFVKNMISGAMNVDAFVFLVAADDGWMPQSEEHLGVLKSLGVSRGIGLVTKVDLVDEARAGEIKRLLAEKLKGAFGKDFPVLPFSTERAELLPPVRAAIEALLAELPKPRDIGAARLWIDRVFLPKGMGVVVTGTLREGTLAEGDDVRLLPMDRIVQVRSLQSYHLSAKEARPVARVALQLARVNAEELERGMLLQKERQVPATKRADARIDFFEPPAKRNVDMAFHAGTLRETALVVPLEEVPAGKTNPTIFCRLQFERLVPLRAGDRFVLRTVGEERTIAAGVIADPVPLGHSHKRAREALAAWAETPAAWVEYQSKKSLLLDSTKLLAQSAYSGDELRSVLGEKTKFRELGAGVYASTAVWERVRQAAVKALEAHQSTKREPLGEGDLVRAIAKTLAFPHQPIRAVLPSVVAAGGLAKEAKGYRLAGAAPKVDAAEEGRRKRVRAFFQGANGEPVSLKQHFIAARDLKQSTYEMVKAGELVALFDENFIFKADYDRFRVQVEQYLKQKGHGSTSELREFLKLSRKNVVLVLEQLDRDRVTYLKDNVRRLMRP